MIEDNRNSGYDRYGRPFPEKILLCNGEELIGHIAVQNHEPNGRYTIALL